MSVGAAEQLEISIVSVCDVPSFILCLTVVLASERGRKGGEGYPLEQ
jgi:hypothetical protein